MVFPPCLASPVAAGPATLLLTTARSGGSADGEKTEVASPHTGRERDGWTAP
jgi:hypothetical protein